MFGTRIVENAFSGVSDALHGLAGQQMIEGQVVLVKRNVLDFTDIASSTLDSVNEVLGLGVVFQLISATVADKNKGRGVVGPESKLENWISTLSPLTPGDSVYNMTFYWDPKQGIPGAFYIKNLHNFEFFLKSVTLNNVPGKGRVHFDCYSWVYPVLRYNYTRIFFSNDTYATSKIPPLLLPYVNEELSSIRGDNVLRQLQEYDRIYGYAIYNDLGDDRPILGGSAQMPYPRRGKTQRLPSLKDPKRESRMLLANIRTDIYCPRDEKFGHKHQSDFTGFALKALGSVVLPALVGAFNLTPMEFDTMQDEYALYEGGIKLPPGFDLASTLVSSIIPFEMVKELLRPDGNVLFKFPKPQVLQADREAWRTDEEFARETVAGPNPLVIELLKEFPPKSKLDRSKYGDQNSTITAAHIEKNMDGVSVQEALAAKRLFILNHHDVSIPFINRINADSGNKVYATRTIFFLREDSTLRPVAIELSLPNPQGEAYGAVSQVFTPANFGVEKALWTLAKAYVAVADNGSHQLINHWLHTHAVMEPFIIATNRQLSAVHPINKLLLPHFRDTMNINSQARNVLVGSGGLMEKTVFTGKYAMEYSSAVYKTWNFLEQGLPTDLIKRGVAVEDKAQPHGLRLLIPDYPFAVDGLAIWDAIKSWVADYISLYYPNDASVAADAQIQSWWKEIREIGHGDHKNAAWWPSATTISSMVTICTTIIWTASALHAAVNFGQYAYAGFAPNRATNSRRLLPEPGTKEYELLTSNPDKALLNTITSQLGTLIGVSMVEILSRHTSDEVYLGHRESSEWTSDQKALEAFQRFNGNLQVVEKQIMERNADPSLKNRSGPAQVAYTLQYPSTSDPAGATGLSGKGIPNSISA